MRPDLIRELLGSEAEGRRLRLVIGGSVMTTTVEEVREDVLVCQDDDGSSTTVDMSAIGALTILFRASDAFAVSKHASFAHEAVEAMQNGGPTFYPLIEQVEAQVIERALQQVPKRNQSAAARILGLNATTLNSMIKKYRIPISRPAAA